MFDPWFETVHENGDKPPDAWDVLLSHHQHKVLDEEDLVNQEVNKDWLSKEELASSRACARRAAPTSKPKINDSQAMAKQEGEVQVQDNPHTSREDAVPHREELSSPEGEGDFTTQESDS